MQNNSGMLTDILINTNYSLTCIDKKYEQVCNKYNSLVKLITDYNSINLISVFLLQHK